MSQVQEDIVEQPVTPVTPAAVEQPVVEETVEIEVTDAEQETPVETKPEAKKPFDPKTDKVDFSTPEQQEKFNYMYKQTKMSDARNQMLTDLLQTQQKQLDELKGRFQQTDSADAERILLGKIKNARDSGDDAAEIAAFSELADFKAQKIISEKVNYQKPVQQQPTADSPEAKYVMGLMQEVDNSGQPVRPWFNENHPEFNNALSALETIKVKYIGDPYALPKSLAELDQHMRSRMTEKPAAPSAQVRAPNPLQGGNLTNVKQKTTIKMTRQELDIAKKLGVDPKNYAAERDSRGRK